MSSAAAEVPTQGEGQWKGLAADPLVRLQCAAIVASAIPFFLPGLSDEWLWNWELFSELPLMAICIVAFRIGIGRLSEAAERRFWNLWTLAIGAWLVKSLLVFVAAPVSAVSVGWEITINCVFFLFYFFAAMALESRPNLPVGPLASALRAVERLGTFVFFIGLLLYLAVVPALLDTDAYATTSMLLYILLDGYLVFRLAGFLRATVDTTWRRTYLWLLATAVLWLITDGLELVTWTDHFDWLSPGPKFDLLWLPAWLTLVMAARVRHVPSAPAERPRRLREFPLGPLVLFTVAVPILHFGLTRLGITSSPVTPILEILALVMLLFLAALVIVRQELMRGETRRLESQREKDLRRIEHLAFHDALTGVPNRRLMTDRLEVGLSRALRYERKLAVLLLDIDDFKAVNDSMGHDVGDAILCEVARRLEGCVRGGDTVARFGGDEFVAVVEELKERNDVSRVVDLMSEVLAEPFTVGEKSLDIVTTIGVAVFPDDGQAPQEILKAADTAMYRARDRRRAQT